VAGTHDVNKSAPLSHWIKRHAFRKNAGCEAAKERVQNEGLAHQAEGDAIGMHRPHSPEWHCALCQAQCVSADDQHLKAN